MIEFNYKTYGDTQKEPLLMLHGFMGESSDWDSLSKKLQKPFYCIALDLPGHGKTISTDESNYTIEKTSESIVQFLKNRNISKTNLLGYSMGGRIAFYLLTKYPALFGKAVIESSSPGLKTEQEKIERLQKDMLLSKRMKIQPLDLFLQDWYNLELFASIDKNSDAFQNMINRKTKNNIDLLALSLKYAGTGAMTSLWNSLSDIQSDVLLITGRLDKKYTNIAKEISADNTKFSHEIIDDVSHNVHFENENIFYNTVDKFLKL